ncbi:hypothetical protein GCM10009007_19240 [Formosimonas limnophila]|uniref:Integrase catalytic domain-containing protein n=1 Tax=Formosimonas limnophila TaxID=1384487 RepID=A0A8J3FZ35_9BURK|nr:hypothetical protein GCM10009007_19240 [Formosimonas limnophila]
MTVGKSFVAQVIKNHQYQITIKRREIRRRPPRPVVINDTWALDLTFYQDAGHVQCCALGIIEHGSRTVVQLKALVNRRSWTLLGYLCLAIGQYGKPKRVRSDNERVFTSWTFRTFLKLTGIHHQTIDTHAPWQNGKIERLFGTLKPLIRQLRLHGNLQFQAALNEFTAFYNHVRPHQNLSGQTPIEVLRQNGRVKIKNQPFPNKESILISAMDGLLTGFYIPPE